MQYELYMDIYLIVNVAINFITLMLVAKLLGYERKKARWIGTSIIVGILNLGLLMLNIPGNSIIQMIIHQFVPLSILLLISYRIRDKIVFIKTLIAAYIIAILVAGVLQIFQKYIPVISIFLSILIATYYFIILAMGFLKLVFTEVGNVYTVTLSIGSDEIVVQALYDTGNSLRDPLTGKSVCVVDKDIGRKIKAHHTNYSTRNIPFHTIGGKGEIAVVEIDSMSIHKENSKLSIQNQLIGITKESLSDKDAYQMILNRECI